MQALITTKIKEITKDETVDIALDTLERNKQALVFCSSKRSAEKTAEDISYKIKIINNKEKLEELSQDVLHVLSKPTKQCERLALCIKKGIAYHHAGLVHEQKEMIEDAFKSSLIKIICCTPTLAYGIDTGAFRAIIKDLRRYGHRGMEYIPVLEYQQMSGRAGRPGKEEYGEAISIANTDAEKDKITEMFILGEPEDIYSKLAVEPVLRMYLLSLIASEFVNSREDILNFFNETFWAHQFSDMKNLEKNIDKILDMLKEFEFIKSDEKDFRSADQKDIKYTATITGKRVSELYLDPLTAHEIITALKRGLTKQIIPFSFLQMISSTLEIRPALRIKMKEYDIITEQLVKYESNLITSIPSEFDFEYEEFLNSIKTALFFEEWSNEKDEEYLLEKYNIRPGEIRTKLEIADWLMYATEELCKLTKKHKILKEVSKLRVRLKYGAREELLALLQLKNIGRVRARKLYNYGIKDIGDVKKADVITLSQLIGKNIAIDIKEQVGEKARKEDIEIKENKRKGQISLKDY